MIREEIKSLRTGERELRKFGLTVGGVFALLGCWFWWRGKTHFPCFLVPGGLLMLLGALVPRALKFIYIGWMSLAFILGIAVSTALLTLFFYMVHEIVYFLVGRGLVGLTAHPSWAYELGAAFANAVLAVLLFAALDKFKQRT